MNHEIVLLKHYGFLSEEGSEKQIEEEKQVIYNSFSLLLPLFDQHPHVEGVSLYYNVKETPQKQVRLQRYHNGQREVVNCPDIASEINFSLLWNLLNGDNGMSISSLDEKRRFRLRKHGTHHEFWLSFSDTAFWTLNRFPSVGICSPEFITFMNQALHHRKSFFIGGGTGSGKSTLLHTLLNSLQKQLYGVIEVTDSLHQDDRFISPQNACIRTSQEDVANVDSGIRNLFSLAPIDYYVMDDVRSMFSFEGLYPFAATLHSNNVDVLFKRMENLHFQGGNFFSSLHTTQLAFSTDFVMQISRLKNGNRRILQVSEVLGTGSYGASLNNERVHKHHLSTDLLIPQKDIKEDHVYTQDIFYYDYEQDRLIRTDWVHEWF